MSEALERELETARADLARAITERDAARYNARLLAFAYTHDVTPGLVFNRAVEESLAYPVSPEKPKRRKRVKPIVDTGGMASWRKP